MTSGYVRGTTFTTVLYQAYHTQTTMTNTDFQVEVNLCAEMYIVRVRVLWTVTKMPRKGVDESSETRQLLMMRL